MSGRQREIELYIDELVLDGFASSDRHAIADALKQELENLLGNSDFASGVDLSTLSLDQLNAGSVTMKTGERSNRLGAQLGQALFQSLNSLTVPDRASTTPARSENDAQSAHPARSSK